jgi:hypothetical protein
VEVGSGGSYLGCKRSSAYCAAEYEAVVGSPAGIEVATICCSGIPGRGLGEGNCWDARLCASEADMGAAAAIESVALRTTGHFVRDSSCRIRG